MEEHARGWQDAPGPPQGSEGHGQQQPDAEEDYNSPLFTSVEFRLWCMKVIPCTKRFVHDWTICPFAHAGEKAVRRDPRLHNYTGIACPDMKKTGNCIRGEKCPYAHNVFEYWLHPTRYRTQLCNDGPTCRRGICFFAHSLDELRVPACKPYVSPEALARASLEAIQQNPHPLGEQLTHPAAAAAQQHAAMAAMSRSRSYGSRELPPQAGLGPHAMPFVPRSTRSSANSTNGGGGGGGNGGGGGGGGYRQSGEPARYSAPGGSSLLNSADSGDFGGMQGEYGQQPPGSYGTSQRFSHPPVRPANFHQQPQYQQHQQLQYQQQHQQHQQHQQQYGGSYSHNNGGGGGFQQQYKQRGQQYASSSGGGAGRLSGNRGGGGSNGSFTSMPSTPSDPAGMDVAVAAAVAEATAAAAGGGGMRGGPQQQQYGQQHQQQQYNQQHQQQQYNQQHQQQGYHSQGPSPPPHQQHAYLSAHVRSPSPAGYDSQPGPGGQPSFAAVQHPPARGFGNGSNAGAGPDGASNGGGGNGGAPPLPATRSGGASAGVPSTRTSETRVSDNSKSEEEGGGGGGGGGSPRSQPAGGAPSRSGRASPAEPDLAQSLASLKIAMTQQQLAATAGSNHEVVITTLHQILKDAMAQQASPSPPPSAFADAASGGAAADQPAPASSFAAVQQQLAAHMAVPPAACPANQWGGANGSPDASAGYSFGSSGATLSAGSQFFPSPRTSSVGAHSDAAAAAVAAVVAASLEGKPGPLKLAQQAQQAWQDTPPPGGSPDAMACYQAALTAAAGGYRGGVLPPRLSTQSDPAGLEASADASTSDGGNSNP